MKMAIIKSSVIASMADTTKIINVPNWVVSSKITSGKSVEGPARASGKKHMH